MGLSSRGDFLEKRLTVLVLVAVLASRAGARPRFRLGAGAGAGARGSGSAAPSAGASTGTMPKTRTGASTTQPARAQAPARLSPPRYNSPMSTVSGTGGEILARSLVVQGADHVFCVPGESHLALLDGLYDEREKVRLIVCRHEAGAANMADAYGKLTGRPGIALVTRGPGATHASVGIHTAFQDSTPVILLVGQVASDQEEREAFQEVDYRRMFGPMAKWVAQIDRVDRIPEYVARAFSTACA